MKRPFLSANVILLSFVSLCNDIASDMIYPLLPLFITSVGGTPAILGVIEGVAETTASLLKLFGGYLSDLFKKRKPLAFAGYFLSNATRPFYFFATSWLPIFFVRFSDRVGKGIRTAPRDALIADSTDPTNRARAFSFHRMLDNFGALVGPLMAMLVLSLSSENIKSVFLFSLIPGFLVIVLMFFVKETKSDGKSSPSKKTFTLKEIFSLNVFPKRFKLFAASVFLFTLGNSSDAFLILRLKESGVATTYLPLIWGLLNLVKSIGNYPMGAIADKTSKKGVIVTGWLLYAVVYLLFALVTSKTAVIAVFLIYGLYFSLTEGVERAFIADIVSEDVRGRAYGLYNFAIGVSALPASVIFGYIWQSFSYKAAFITGASFSILALILFIFSEQKKAN
ncbi:MAG: MFS transporter [bacterium]